MVLWSLLCHKKLKLTTKLFTGRTLGGLLIQMQSISLRSLRMHRKQNFSPPLFFCFSCLIFFSLAGHLVGFILVGRVFRKAFRILGLGERKGRWVMEQDFHGDFQVLVTWFFASFSSVLDWIVLILVWFERSLHSAQVSRQSCPWQLKLMTSHAVERTWIRTSGYEQLRGEWVNNFILATKLTELIEDVRWRILLQVKFDLRWLLNVPLATGL